MSRKKSPQKDAERIDDIVRRAYEGLLNEELPDRFTVLIERLKQGELPRNQQKKKEN